MIVRLCAATLGLCLLHGAMVQAQDVFDSAQSLGRGINVLGYDPLWSDPAKARFTPELFKVIAAGGFQTVRVNLQAFAHMDAHDRLDPQWLHSLDAVVQQASAAGLKVILDEHDFHPCAQNAETCRSRLLAFWGQVAVRFRDAPGTVLFEVLNEPSGELTAAKWNALLAEVLATIRQSNPQRGVIVGPAKGNYFTALPDLQLPDTDRHLIVTLHYYNPFSFTHQGAPWTRADIRDQHDVHWGDQASRSKLYHEFDVIADWARAHDRPVLLGEFGAYEAAPAADRLAWTVAVVNAAEKRHFAWAYWQFEGSFGAYDLAQGHWNEAIHKALVASDGAWKR